MPEQCRVSDMSKIDACKHGCPKCPHPAVGPGVKGSPDVKVNGLAALRVGDPGFHALCCNTNKWTCKDGSSTVFINGKAAHRKGDADTHCGGDGSMIMGSPNVFSGG